MIKIEIICGNLECENNTDYHCMKPSRYIRLNIEGTCIHKKLRDYPTEAVVDALDNDHPQSRKKIHTKEVNDENPR